ncbi:Deoxyribose-phosphate aldolase [Tritrichomonas foetus]|uniref:deoxyribose-phosphate aldolase n=1 Tax=Tritrichomonas foetus TaxID=1144522 RepID=A0A1J4JKS2_9EUKA|nr:Deoxyribose-phosphate aldolase [Tritrichomonas foetus]|eukprot:OHS99233.1 Deoxyribose-phosphate aldolase [Tritrichomonas foetus]
MDISARVQFVAEKLGVQAAEVQSRLDNAKEDKTIPADKQNIPAHVDFTVLNAFATAQDIVNLCEKAKKYNTISVCVNPNRVSICKKELEGTGIRIASVVGFPLGATTSASKAFESKCAVDAGADEIDMVIDIGALIEGDYKKVSQDIEEIVAACPGKYIKCIIETCYLTKDQIIDASILTVYSGADNVKTSTGFGKEGATVENVKIMRQVVGPKFGVKAAGGVRTKEAAHAMIDSGASRIGASSPALFE